MDDDLLVTKSNLITAQDGLYKYWCTHEPIEYYPVTYTTLWIEWRLWGMRPAGYHITNMLLHVLEALLIWIILRKLSIPGAFLAAVIFAVHPVNVESVAWIAQCRNMTAMLFFLLSILWYIRFDERARLWLAAKQFTAHCPPSTAHCCLWYCLSLAAFVLAMLGKGSAAVMPALLLGIIWWLRPVTRRDLLRIAPFLSIAAALSAVNVWFQTQGSGEVLRDARILERLLGAGGVVWFYLYKAILPFNLSFIYPQWNIEAGNLLWWTPLLAALGVTAILWRFRNSWSRAPLFAWGFFCTGLTPVMGFVDVGFMKYSLVADHYQHISLISAIALTVAGWGIWRRRMGITNRLAANAVAALAVCTLAFMTWQQSRIYDGRLTLYQDVLQKNSACWLAHDNLGVALCDAGRTKEAIKQYDRALELNPDDSAAHCNMGNALLQIGRNKEAIEHCEQAIRLKPKFPEAYNNLGNALVKAGRVEEGIKNYELAIQLDPDYVNAHCNLGNALLQAGRFPEAAEHFQQALRLKPDFAEIHNNLGTILDKTGRPWEAIEHYQQALKLKPDNADAHFNLGNAFVTVGEHQKASEQFKQALALKPDDFKAHYNLGNALVQIGRSEEAIDHYRQALRLKPEFVDAYINLALTCAGLHQSSEAIAAAQKALELARSQGKTDQARQIEDWLNSYSAGSSNKP